VISYPVKKYKYMSTKNLNNQLEELREENEKLYKQLCEHEVRKIFVERLKLRLAKAQKAQEEKKDNTYYL